MGENRGLGAVCIVDGLAVMGDGNLAPRRNIQIGGAEQFHNFPQGACNPVGTGNLIECNVIQKRHLARFILNGYDFPEARAVVGPFIWLSDGHCEGVLPQPDKWTVYHFKRLYDTN